MRQSKGTWLFTAVSGVTLTARLRCLEIDLPLAEVYAGVQLPQPPQAEVHQKNGGT